MVLVACCYYFYIFLFLARKYVYWEIKTILVLLSMMKKTISIPKYLHEIHGKHATPLGLLLTYLAGILFGLVGAIIMYQHGVELWKALLIGFLFFDVGGGVVANLTSSTNQYYQESPKLRLVFLYLHLLQPALLALLVNEYGTFALFLAAYTLGSGLVVHRIRSIEAQQITASTLTVIGITGLTFFNVSPPIIYAFGALFIIKILIGFSVRRPNLQ